MSIRFGVTLLVGFVVAACGQDAQQPTVDPALVNLAVEKPNIVFILVDDMGFNDAGFNGGELATPNLDDMAASGLRLDRNYVYPICSPTRAALLTGQLPLRHGVDGPMSDTSSLPKGLRLMPEYLKDLGYQTAMVGKWHLGIGDHAFMPNARGFDHYYGFLGGWVDFYTHVYNGGLDWQRNGVSVREEGHATDLLTAEAIRVIGTRNAEQPLFLYLAYNSPHTPLHHVPENSGLNGNVEAGDRAVYAEMVTQMDAGVGEVLAALEAAGMLSNTLIVFSSDNGGLLAAGASNGSLSGGKGAMLEGGTRVPGVVWWPGRVEGGRVMQQMIAVHDWLPTLLDAAGGDPAIIDDAHGQSMWAAIENGDDVDRAVTTLGVANTVAAYDFPWKLLDHTPRGRDAVRSLRLFNVEQDPGESTDLSADYPDRVAALQKTLDAVPSVPSRRSTEPPPERYFRNADRSWNYDLRLEETRETWAESARNAP